jgi:3-methyladenine DNA glycosylase AlkD
MNSFILELEKVFKEHQNPTKAKAMEAYMKNKFSFFGIPMPERRSLQKPFCDAFKTLAKKEQCEIIIELWTNKEREFHYATLDFMDTWKEKNYEMDDIQLLENMICSHTWWDSVDTIASKCVGKYFNHFPEQIQPICKRWMLQDNFWLHRTCLLFQLTYKEKTNFELLENLIENCKENKEFFIQKAIGWSLRQYARIDPERVLDCVERQQLVGLAKREALRKIVN